MASIGWIDFSPSHRDRIGSVLDLLTPEGMVDELGLGTIRDALANQLFPGISTIQTRAKYFFIIPYILYDYQITKPTQRRGKSPAKFLEDKEYQIMWQLAEKYNYVEGKGVIGITKRKPDKIARRPSAIYWNGLYTYQFIDTQGLGAESFLKKAESPTMESLLSAVQQGDDLTGDDIDAEHENRFRIKVAPKLNWDEGLMLDLSQDEAEFFRDRIISISRNKLISELLTNENLWQIFIKAKDFMQFVKAAISTPMPAILKSTLILAHDFSELMYGAHLAYNCEIQNRVFKNDEFDSQWDTWHQSIQDNMLDYSGFNPNELFSYAITTRETTAEFVKEWWVQTQSDFSNLSKRNSLLQQQEAMVKAGKARLRWNKTEDVKESHWIGLKHFDYRFVQAKVILTDIRTGLKN